MKKIITLIAVVILFASCDKKDEYVYRCDKMIHKDRDCEKLKKYAFSQEINKIKIKKIEKRKLTEEEHGKLLLCDKCFSVSELEDIKTTMKDNSIYYNNYYKDMVPYGRDVIQKQVYGSNDSTNPNQQEVID